MSEEIEIERVPGLPGTLPEGERLLWQGRPAWRALARGSFKLPWLALYFTAFAVARVVVAVRAGEGWQSLSVVPFAVLAGGTCLGLVALYAWLVGQSTIYSITSRRLVVRLGVALPMTLNFPFRRVTSADLVRRGEHGDICLTLSETGGIGWVHLWPHVKPLPVLRPRPTLLALPRPEEVAALLGEAVRAWAAEEKATVITAPLPGQPPAERLPPLATAR